MGSWTLFIAENLVLSENRTYIISELGDDGYHYLYGLCSTVAVGSILYGYRYKIRGAGPHMWPSGGRPGPAALAASFSVQALALVMMSQSFPKLQIPVETVSTYDSAPSHPTVPALPPSASAGSPWQWKVRCPFDFTDSRSQTGSDGSAVHDVRLDGTADIHGLDRVSRHPGLWSFGLLGVGNALLVSSVPTRVLLSMPIVMSLIGGSHTDSRHRRGVGGSLPKQLDDATSNLPFLAMVTGRQEGGSVTKAFGELAGEVKWLNSALALSIAACWVARKGRGGAPLNSIATAALSR